MKSTSFTQGRVLQETRKGNQENISGKNKDSPSQEKLEKTQEKIKVSSSHSENERLSENPKKPASEHVKFKKSDDGEKLQIMQVKKPFSEIVKDSQPCFYALSETENNIVHAVTTLRDDIAKVPEQALHLKTYTKRRDNPDKYQVVDITQEDSYRALKGNRNDSLLESYIPKNSPFRSKLYPLTGGIRDVNTGLYAELRRSSKTDSGEVFLCIPGTGAAATDAAQWSANIKQFTFKDSIPEAYAQACELVDLLRDDVELMGETMIVVGHSLGGGMANYAGLKCDIEARCFNATPLGPACLEDLKDDLTPERLAKQLHFRVKGDAVTSPKAQKKLNDFIHPGMAAKGRAPANLGTIYEANDGDEGFPEYRGIRRHQLNAFEGLYAAMLNKTNSSAATTQETITTTTTTTATNTTTTDSSPPREDDFSSSS